jgi:hypothetical protein
MYMDSYIIYDEGNNFEEKPSSVLVEDLLLELAEKVNKKFAIQEAKIEELWNKTGKLDRLAISFSENRLMKEDVNFQIINTRKEILNNISNIRQEIIRIRSEIMQLKEHQNDIARNKISVLD